MKCKFCEKEINAPCGGATSGLSFAKWANNTFRVHKNSKGRSWIYAHKECVPAKEKNEWMLPFPDSIYNHYKSAVERGLVVDK